ncbi:hypothetical protein [Macrococcoides canis]|uniref:hypothetical protein n=1 Tax=Macrococcoides canis TaxID=1855823 RepID=UPI0020B89899|nr:hypothetical protein [Macrococcus canis]UTH10767.1 hypothetical protein KFV10_07545 [Macrococcus canis]
MYLIEKFYKEIKAFDYHLKMQDHFEESDEGDSEFMDMINLIYNIKKLEYYLENNTSLTYDEGEFLNEIDKLFNKNYVKKLYEIIDIKVEDETLDIDDPKRYSIQIHNIPLMNFFTRINQSEPEYDYLEQLQLLYKSSLYNLCTICEKYFGLIYKDYLLNHRQQVDFKDEKLSYSELVNIGSIENSKIFLIDRRLSNLFVKSSKDWLDFIFKEIKINSKTICEDNKYFEELHEMYNLRNLFIHSDGIVNDMFLDKTISYKHYKKGHKIALDINELNKYRNNVLNLLFSTFYEYYNKVYRNDEESLRHTLGGLNNTLLKEVNDQLDCIPKLFNKLSKNDKVRANSRYYAIVNELIYYYHNDKEKLQSELDRFDDSILSDEYKMAKAILSENNEVAIKYIDDIINKNEEDIFDIYTWPLIKIASNNDSNVNLLLNERISDILSLRSDEDASTIDAIEVID